MRVIKGQPPIESLQDPIRVGTMTALGLDALFQMASIQSRCEYSEGITMKKQKVEHATAERILEAAQEIFIAKGFEGSSINDIANNAKINKSLIYHHFSNKASLWKAVKKHILQRHGGEESLQVEFPMDSFKSFLTSFISLRFKFYENNPEIVRLITWQRLENTQEDLSGIQNPKLNSVIPQIIEFQQRGEVRSDLDPEMVNYLIMKTASVAFMEKPKFFEDQKLKENKQKFLELIIESLYLAFSTTSALQKKS